MSSNLFLTPEDAKKLIHDALLGQALLRKMRNISRRPSWTQNFRGWKGTVFIGSSIIVPTC